jgi:DNA-binding winged helix-turn-helix (wHTH) protein
VASRPVIVLTPDEAGWAPLRALEAGADDCIRRSVGHLELRACVRAVLRRTRRTLASVRRRVGPLTLDPHRQEVRLAGRRLEPARYEYLLLTYLDCDPERVFTKRELLRDIWGYRTEARTRTLDAHARRLRKKLTQAGAVGYVVNRRGVGYRLPRPRPGVIDQGQPGLTGDVHRPAAERGEVVPPVPPRSPVAALAVAVAAAVVGDHEERSDQPLRDRLPVAVVGPGRRRRARADHPVR